MAACPSDVGPNAKEMVWSDLYASLWLTANRVECTGSLSTSEFKQHRTRLILGWGTAREVLRALSAVAIVIMAALPRFATPKTKEMAWSDLFASWSLAADRVECTGSRSISEFKQHRAQIILGWGTAREVLRALSAVAIVIKAALPRVVTPKTKEMAWSDLFASWSLTGKQCRPYRDERTGSLSTSEGKLHRVRSVLGLGTAREVLRMLSCVAIVITTALPSVVEPDTKETV